MHNIEQKIDNIQQKIDNIEQKIDNIMILLNNDIKKNTEKMGSHIDFVENIYENIKSPLGFLCSKLNLLKKNDNHVYELTDKN